jgi:hypothetical protein
MVSQLARLLLSSLHGCVDIRVPTRRRQAAISVAAHTCGWPWFSNSGCFMALSCRECVLKRGQIPPRGSGADANYQYYLDSDTDDESAYFVFLFHAAVAFVS